MSDLTTNMNEQVQQFQLPKGELTISDASKFINSVVKAEGATVANNDDAKRVFDFVEGIALTPKAKFPSRGQPKQVKQATFLQAQCYQHSIGVDRDIEVAAMQYIKVLSAGRRQAPAARRALAEINREFMSIVQADAEKLAGVKSTPLSNDFPTAASKNISADTAALWSAQILKALKDNPARKFEVV